MLRRKMYSKKGQADVSIVKWIIILAFIALVLILIYRIATEGFPAGLEKVVGLLWGS